MIGDSARSRGAWVSRPVWRERGSHVKLRRTRTDGATETLTIPAHREVKLGTLHELFAQAARFIPEAELRPHFYTD